MNKTQPRKALFVHKTNEIENLKFITMKNYSILFSLAFLLSIMVGCSNNERDRSDEIDMMDSRDTLRTQYPERLHDSVTRDSMMRDSLPTQPIKH